MAAIAKDYRRLPIAGAGVLFASIFFTLISLNTGLEDIYSNSYISPNSANNAPHKQDGREILATVLGDDRRRVHRSADPILVKSYDDLAHFQNFAEHFDGNEVESSGRAGKFIHPSKTLKQAGFTSMLDEGKLSGEGSGAPREKQLLEPHTETPRASAIGFKPAPLDRPRQSNPDIQDIITGLVKLLNGNVNVQANTAPTVGGRPLRPLSTRINNRGPPRITDVPALPPDFDVPSQSLPLLPPTNQKPPTTGPTRMPPPYPFDLPPPVNQNTSPVRPMSNQNGHNSNMNMNTKRPGLYRPATIPPWSRPPYRRPFPQRRPTPIPPYNPKPEDTISITSERPGEDLLTLDLGSGILSSIEDHKNDDTPTTPSPTEPSEPTEEVPTEDVSEIEFEKNKEKSSSKMEKHSSTHSQTYGPHTSASTESITASESTIIEEIPVTSSSEQNIVPSSVLSNEVYSTENLETINTTSSTSKQEQSTKSENETIESSIIESSIVEVPLKVSTSSEPTEALPTIHTTIMGSTASAVISTQTSSEIEVLNMTSTQITNKNNTSQTDTNQQTFPYYPYRPRPGIVLDDTEYKPGGINRPPILTARPPIGQIGEIFDVTVSAIQGPGGSSGGHGTQGKPYVIPVDIENIHGGRPIGHHGLGDVITSPTGDEGFVSIDGKRTYLNLFGDQTEPPVLPSTGHGTQTHIAPTASKSVVKATGYAEVEKTKIENLNPNGGPNGLKPTPRRPLYGNKRPVQPPVRIDTCIVGDDSTCDASQYEYCMTEAGVSSCHCRPGHARRKHREPCRKVVSLLISLRVDRLYDHRVVWSPELGNKGAEVYQQLSYEAERALDSAMSMTPFSDEFLGARVNNVYEGDRSQGQAGVFVNLTLQVEENSETSRQNVKGDIQRHLLGVIQRRSNNIGNSALWVESPPGSVSMLQDVDECSTPELNDCHQWAKCVNTFGGFKCVCSDGYRDPWSDNKHRSGRQCEQCSPAHCNNRGECKYEGGQEVCLCTGNYYGAQCELDGEVLGVAIGASVAAVIIIGLTLVCLVMWSRRWNREQKAAMGSPVFGYMATASNSVKTPVVGGPPYQLTLEDRLRWAQIADAMAQTNHYAPEPVHTTTRPSSAMFGYPNLSMAGTLPHGNLHGTLPPIPLPRLTIPATLAGRAASIHGMRPLDNSSSSEEEDKADLLGRNFQVPRPKSRSNASIANQSGIYYDVDYDQNDIYKHPSGNIPMSTYTAGRHPFYRN